METTAWEPIRLQKEEEERKRGAAAEQAVKA